MSYAELAGKGKIPHDTALIIIAAQARRLLHLTNDILDVSRIEGGRMKYNLEKVGVNDIISEIVLSHQSVNADKNSNVQINLLLNTDKSVTIHADRMRMSQVLNNVIGNAIKFTSKGAVNVEASYLNDQRKDVRITVSDTGPGISPEIIQRIFGKVVAQTGTINNQQGTGLGLFISKAIVEGHGGRIFASNNSNGVGATFTIILPVHTFEASEPDNIGTVMTRSEKIRSP